MEDVRRNRRGRKKGITTGVVNTTRNEILLEYNKIYQNEKLADPIRAKFLPTKYFALKIQQEGRFPYTQEYIAKIICYRHKRK